ncbi:MAG: hypothetical protein C4325_02245 [Blastocatellia bacterium]
MNCLYTLVFAGLVFNLGNQIQSPFGKLGLSAGDAMKIEGFASVRKIANNRWVLGNGGRQKYVLRECDSAVTIRSREEVFVN